MKNQQVLNKITTLVFRVFSLFVLVSITFTMQATPVVEPPPEKAIVCSACHGSDGVSSNPEWPNIAGQHAGYLIKELQDYKKGDTRNTSIMTPMVAQLTTADIEALAAFYASKPLKHSVPPKKPEARGESLYRRGDFERHITACITCHGPQGTGNNEAGFPVVAGQQVNYTVLQLQAFKTGARRNDLKAIMQDISQHMSHEDMEAIAQYISGL